MKRSILLRHADERVHRLAVARARELQRDREAEIGNERERMRRIDRERRQHREDVVAGNGPRARSVSCLVTSAPSTSTMPSLRQLARAARASAPAGRSRARATASPMRASCSAGRQPVGALGRDAGAHLALEAGDAHHEEFVEIVGRDRQEAHPLEQRMGDVLRLLEHAAVEVEPGQLAVDEALGACRQIGLGRAPAQPPRTPARRCVSSVRNNGLAAIHAMAMNADVRGHDRSPRSMTVG